MITKRIENLRNKSLNTRPSISGERAQLMTAFYASEEAKGLSAPLLRAKAFRYLMANKTIYIGDEELIIGERGPAPQQTPTYPEVCIHTIPDLELINDRPKVKFTVDQDLKKLYRDTLIPFWAGKSSRDKIFKALPKSGSMLMMQVCLPNFSNSGHRGILFWEM